jgi:acetylornithine deacetylase
MTEAIHNLEKEALKLLQHLIETPSFSKEEDRVAGLIEKFLKKQGVHVSRVGNNVFAVNRNFRDNLPTILLNSHHDTVKPNQQYTRDPFSAVIEDDKLYGLGSNDAGGCLVSLIAAFLHFYDKKDLKYNLALAATAEEEISGTGGIASILSFLPPLDCAIVGEPTLMQMAVAERGLLVLDCTSHGKAGHAARGEGDNAIYHAFTDINWFRTFEFPKASELLGPNKMNVTVIETSNKAHNVVPAHCHFVVDIRVNELYTFEEVLQTIRSHVRCDIMPRSTRLRSSAIPMDHPLVKAGLELGLTSYGSPTTSDKALMPFPALKMGPGDSARSHMPNEYIYVTEISEGITVYIALLKKLL